MKSLDIHNCEIGVVSSRQDHSCKFSVITPELKVSESGELLQWHGRVCRVFIQPHEGPSEETIKVDAERHSKSWSQRLRGVLYVLWEHEGRQGDFESYYAGKMSALVGSVKMQLP